MNDEIASLANDTWTMQPAPPSIKPIPVRWVYKEKRDLKGNIERYKARLVVKGFHQREGIDYDEVFAPVSKYSTLRTLLALAADQDLEIHQLDVKTAFLNGTLHEDVYIQQPPGYSNGCWTVLPAVQSAHPLRRYPQDHPSCPDSPKLCFPTPSQAD